MTTKDSSRRSYLFWLRTPDRAAVVDPKRRIAACLLGYSTLLLVFWTVLVVQQRVWGEAYRAEATRPQRRVESVVAPRGRIYSADGQLMADHRRSVALALHYRFFEDPPDRGWLRRQARARIDRRHRSDPMRLEQAECEFLQWREAQTARLAELCGMSPEAWKQRTAAIQSRIERIADRVQQRSSRRSADGGGEPQDSKPSLAGFLARIVDAVRSAGAMADGPPIVLAEQRQHHIVADDLSSEAVETIRREFGSVPSVRLIERTKRFYPQGATASHLIGYLGATGPEQTGELNERWMRALGDRAACDSGEQVGRDGGGEASDWSGPAFDDEEAMALRDQAEYQAEDWAGAAGIERQYEIELRGRRGRRMSYPSASGRVLAAFDAPPPTPGRDLVLTIDLRLQRQAEELLDAALQRAEAFETSAPRGGAIVVLDAATGGVVVAASSPRYDPNVFLSADRTGAARLLADPSRPLFDRAVQMALPPGSAFKVASAVALLHCRGFDPNRPFVCQGYLEQADRQRCELFVRSGRGHGATTLSDALAESCNVFFFHHVGAMGAEDLLLWARRLGLGSRTGIDLPAEGVGSVPKSDVAAHGDSQVISQSETWNLAIGQGTLTATPLQMAVVMAAVANGGRRVQPHLLAGEMLTTDGRVDSPGSSESQDLAAARGPLGRAPLWTAPMPNPIEGIDPESLKTLREGLKRAVADESGTAHSTVYWELVEIAGKTGTAESGPGRPSHAWFVGYVPADRPRFAFSVAIEHGGSGALAAGPVAKRLVMALHRLGMLD